MQYSAMGTSLDAVTSLSPATVTDGMTPGQSTAHSDKPGGQLLTL